MGQLLVKEMATHSSIIFFFFFFYFTTLYWFCHTSTCIHHGCTRVPILKPPPTALPIPSLWVIPVHQPQASCILHWTWTDDSFLIWYYTCFNAILPNHPPPFPLPQSPKDCSIHLCLLATPVFFPGISHGRRSLVGYSPCGRKELDMTEWLHFHFFIFLLKFSLLCFKGLVTYHPIATVHDHKNGEWLGIELWPRTHI